MGQESRFSEIARRAGLVEDRSRGAEKPRKVNLREKDVLGYHRIAVETGERFFFSDPALFKRKEPQTDQRKARLIMEALRESSKSSRRGLFPARSGEAAPLTNLERCLARAEGLEFDTRTYGVVPRRRSLTPEEEKVVRDLRLNDPNPWKDKKPWLKLPKRTLPPFSKVSVPDQIHRPVDPKEKLKPDIEMEDIKEDVRVEDLDIEPSELDILRANLLTDTDPD
jgi:hypothetical protein